MNSKHRIILYFPYEIDVGRLSASSIRPQKIMENFTKYGHDPFIISGDSKSRKTKIKELKNLIKSGVKFNSMYMETSTMPYFLTDKHHLPLRPFLEVSLFNFCRKNNITTGVFYRDVQWRFDFYDKATAFFKRNIAKIFYNLELRVFNKYIDVIYLPTFEMHKYLPEFTNPKILLLPPALDSIVGISKYHNMNRDRINLFYSGGIMSIYDLTPTIELLNLHSKYHLYLVCRQAEWESSKERYLELLDRHTQLTVLHIGRDEALTYSNRIDFSVFILGEEKYLEFAMPFKIFDYLQMGKPILTLDGTATSSFVVEHKIGKSFQTIESLNNYISNASEDEILTIYENINKERVRNTWKDRVTQIESDLRRR